MLYHLSRICVTESTTLSKPPFSYDFIISLCIYLTKISINIFENKIFDSGFKIINISLETNDGLILGWKIIHSTIYSLNNVVIVL